MGRTPGYRGCSDYGTAIRCGQLTQSGTQAERVVLRQLPIEATESGKDSRARGIRLRVGIETYAVLIAADGEQAGINGVIQFPGAGAERFQLACLEGKKKACRVGDQWTAQSQPSPERIACYIGRLIEL